MFRPPPKVVEPEDQIPAVLAEAEVGLVLLTADLEAVVVVVGAVEVAVVTVEVVALLLAVQGAQEVAEAAVARLMVVWEAQEAVAEAVARLMDLLVVAVVPRIQDQRKLPLCTKIPLILFGRSTRR